MELDRRQVPFSSNRKDISRFNSPSRHPDYIDDRWIQGKSGVLGGRWLRNDVAEVGPESSEPEAYPYGVFLK
jgi:hypothetical protein